MAGFRGMNLRLGDLAEQLGILLLQNFSLVVPVPRTEDVGIDAVVTLLRQHDSRRVIASDSFFIQFKAISVSQIEYLDEEVAWLYGLELPFFIGSVDRASNLIRLYCCHRLSDALITNYTRKKLVLHLAEEEKPDDFVDSDVDDVFVGPPILEWSMSDVTKDEMKTLFYDICKAHVGTFREAMEHRRVGHSPYIVWRTNEVPKIIGWKTCCSSSPGEKIEPIADLMMPYVSAMLDESLRAKDPRWLLEIKSLIDERLTAIEIFNKAAELPNKSNSADA